MSSRLEIPSSWALLALVACGGGAAPLRATEASAAAQATFDAERAWRHMEALVGFGERPSGSAAIEELRAYLEKELRALGLRPEREPFREETPIGPIDFCNVYVDVPGSRTGPGAPLVVLATHFDTKRGLGEGFVGANDGASGTAVLLELGRCLTARERVGPVTYRLLFLDGEEAVGPKWRGTDNTYGSRHHVDQLRKRGALERVKACIVLDMVGDADLRLTHELYSDPRLLRIFFDAAIAGGLRDHVAATPREIRDDHLPFLRADIPSLDLIDFEYGPANDYWHSPDDTLDKCSVKSLEVIGRIVLAALPALEGFAVG